MENNQTFKIVNTDEIAAIYNKVIQNKEIKGYRCVGGKGRYSYGYNPVDNSILRVEGEHYFDNPNYSENTSEVEIDDDFATEPVAEETTQVAEETTEEASAEPVEEAATEPEQPSVDVEALLKEIEQKDQRILELEEQNKLYEIDLQNISQAFKVFKNIFTNV